MTRQSKLVALPLILILAACGGGGGSSIASAPPPVAVAPTTPSPTPAPASVPAATTYDAAANYVNVAVSDSVIPTQSFSIHAVISHVGSTVGSLGEAVVWASNGNNISIGRDDWGGYVLEMPLIEFLTSFDGEAVGVRRPSFAANTRYSISGGSPNFEHYAARASAQSTNRVGDNRLLLDRSRLTYATFGTVEFCRDAAASECVDPSRKQYAEFIFGQVTPAGQIPLSGTASFSGGFDASDAQGIVYSIAGNAHLDIDFARTAVSGLLSNIRGHFDDALTSGSNFALPDYAVDGALRPGGLLEGRLLPAANADGWIAGSWSGSLYGPGAAEVGAVLNLPNSNGDSPLFGTLAAKRDGP